MGCSSVLRSVAILLQTAVAIAAIVITVLHLNGGFPDVSISLDNSPIEVQLGTCALGTNSRIPSLTLCSVTYIVAGVSLAASLALGLFLCITCDACGLRPIFDFLFATAGLIWWTLSGLLVLETQQQYNALLPSKTWRTVIVSLYFSAAGLFAISVLVALYQAFAMCCCSGSRQAKQRYNGAKGAHQAPIVVMA